MTLRTIVAALGGDLYAGGCQANVPAPGHSRADRSVSLLLVEGRVIVHGFGAADWRTVRDTLQAQAFIDGEGRLTGAGRAGPSAPRPDRRVRLASARRLWDGGGLIRADDPASRHLRQRGVPHGETAGGLRCHPAAPVSVYRTGAWSRPALLARISDPDDRLTAVEVTYLDANGRRAIGLALSRKTVGVVPPGSAVRLAAAATEMLVAEGVVTTLSAMNRFGLPGWALLSANNLAAWTPPEGVRRLLIAADRGAVGEEAADRLRRRLAGLNVEVRIAIPEFPFGDWNDAAPGRWEGKEEGR